MNGTLDRWYVSGPLGVGTTFNEFNEQLDVQSSQSVSMATIGSAFRHEGWETLNLLDSRVAGIGQGPNLNLWGLNAAKKAVRLGTISARFSATADAGSSSFLSFHTKPANGDVREVLRIDGDGNVHISGRLGVGTRFDEPLDAQSMNSIPSMKDIGSAIRHEGWETLNLFDSRPPVIGRGPNLNWWGRNAANKAVRLGTVSARFTNATDGATESYLSFHAKTATGDVKEVMSIDASGNVHMVSTGFNTLTVGSGANGEIRVRHVNGKNWTNNELDGLYLNWGTGKPVTVGNEGVNSDLVVHGNLYVRNSTFLAHVGGNVGIGTTTPRQKLDVPGGAVINGVVIGADAPGINYPAEYETVGVANPAFNLRLQSPNNIIFHTGDAPTEKLILTEDGRLVVHNVLDVQGSAVLRHGFVQFGDMAENFESQVALEPGEVVSFDPDGDGVLRAATANDTLVCGVVSTAPGVLLNCDPDASDREGRVPVALCGRVPCKVVDENGPIHRGDLLTSSSIPGHAMRAEPVLVDGEPVYRSGTIVGKALAAHASGTGVIDIFVGPS